MITTLWHFLIPADCDITQSRVLRVSRVCVLTAVIITHCTWSPVHSSAGLTVHLYPLVTRCGHAEEVALVTGHRYWAASLKVALTPVQVSSLPGYWGLLWWWWRGLAGSAGPTGTRRREHRTQNTEQQDPASRSGGSAAPARSLDTIADPPHSNTNTSHCLNRQPQC